MNIDQCLRIQNDGVPELGFLRRSHSDLTQVGVLLFCDIYSHDFMHNFGDIVNVILLYLACYVKR